MFLFLALNGIKPGYSQAEPASLIREASKGEASRPEIFRWISDQENDLFKTVDKRIPRDDKKKIRPIRSRSSILTVANYGYHLAFGYGLERSPQFVSFSLQ